MLLQNLTIIKIRTGMKLASNEFHDHATNI
jgi:hypothetical protein